MHLPNCNKIILQWKSPRRPTRTRCEEEEEGEEEEALKSRGRGTQMRRSFTT
jgi:hypothetical protein